MDFEFFTKKVYSYNYTVCNMSLHVGIFPDIFKQAIITPVFKGNGKDPHDPGSYRPISILPVLSKILEIAVRDALLD